MDWKTLLAYITGSVGHCQLVEAETLIERTEALVGFQGLRLHWASAAANPSLRYLKNKGYCQVVGSETLIRQAGASPRSYLPFRQPLGARHVGPTLESLPHLLTVIRRRQQMPPGSEVLADGPISVTVST